MHSHRLHVNELHLRLRLTQFDIDRDYDLTLDLRDRLFREHPELCLMYADAPGVSSVRQLLALVCM